MRVAEDSSSANFNIESNEFNPAAENKFSATRHKGHFAFNYVGEDLYGATTIKF